MKHTALLLTAVILTFSACSGTRWGKASQQPPAFAQAAVAQTTTVPTGQSEDTQTEQTQEAKPASPQPAAAPKAEAAPKAAAAPSIDAANAQTPKETQKADIKEAAAPKDKQEDKKEEPQTPSFEKIIGADGRLIHPWYTAEEVKNFTGAKPKWFGESLKFKIGWSFITAGEADLITGKIVNADGQPAFAVEAYAQSYSVIDKMFRVRDMNVSWIAGDLTKSLGYWQSVREGRYKRDEWLKFNYKKHDYIVYKQNNKGNFSEEAFDFEGDAVWDMLTALYYVRMQPLPDNGEVYFDIVNAKKYYPLKVIVHGKETVKVKAGKFDCILVEPVISGEGIFVSKGKSLKVWLTDDEYRMPVKMSVEVFIGSVKAELASYKRGK